MAHVSCSISQDQSATAFHFVTTNCGRSEAICQNTVFTILKKTHVIYNQASAFFRASSSMMRWRTDSGM